MTGLCFIVGDRDVRVMRTKFLSYTALSEPDLTPLTPHQSLEDLGTISIWTLIERGFLRHELKRSEDTRSHIARRLSSLSHNQSEDLLALMLARKAGFATSFLHHLNEMR